MKNNLIRKVLLQNVALRATYTSKKNVAFKVKRRTKQKNK